VPSHTSTWATALVGLLGLLAVGASPSSRLPSPPGVTDSPLCDRYVSSAGSDRGTGGRQRPFRTVTRLVRALRPGQTGCLIGELVEDQVIIRRGGKPGAPIRLRSLPGTRATLRGRLTIGPSASYVVVAWLNLDGRNSIGGASPTVLGDRAVFRGNDVTNYNTEICFILGSLSRGYVAEGTVIDGNRIHNCGKLPPQNQDHGIYLEYARDTRIVNNYIYDNADRGIQLYPDADGTLVANNVIDGNGEGIIFSGSGSLASDRNTVRDNVIANSAVRYNVEYYYSSGGATGEGNVVTRNCLWNGAQGDIIGDGIAFTASDNIVADPLYLDRASKDFRLRAESPCLHAHPLRRLFSAKASR
jgi:parallel beta-helix repeat protein